MVQLLSEEYTEALSMSFTTLISSSQLGENIGANDWAVIDCRFSLADPAAGRRLYEESHLPSAHYAHLDEDLSSPVTDTSGRHPLPDPQALCRQLDKWGVAAETQVVAYDDAGGAFAARLWWLLRWLGHESAAVLDGGFPAWVEGGLPMTAEIPRPSRTDYVCRPNDESWLSAAQVTAGLAGSDLLLIDARDPERFRGESEPIDPVAGHVPGAINAPFKANLSSSGRFLSPEQLRARFEPLLAASANRQVVHMCGSGVTACHNLLAMEVAGLPAGKLYAGSWSEWGRDASRPVAVGPQ
jgi:thiosulfate/3-mercaptopyruvate sulfurtransferase